MNASREGVNAGVMLRCHLFACAQAARAHDLTTASTERACLTIGRLSTTAHATATGQVARALAVVAAVVNLLLDVVHLPRCVGCTCKCVSAGISLC
jgi:hypothetical protein